MTGRDLPWRSRALLAAISIVLFVAGVSLAHWGFHADVAEFVLFGFQMTSLAAWVWFLLKAHKEARS